MLFNSGAFAIFLPLVFVVYWTLRGGARRWWLLAASYFFYAWWDWRFVGLLIVHTLTDYAFALLIEGRRASLSGKRFLVASLTANLGVLCAFKYFNFFRDSLAAMFASIGWHADLPTLNFILPLGISFYTFQTMSYTIDVYRGLPAERNIRDFALSIACFAHLVAGPIVRARDLMPQFKIEHRFADVDFSGVAYRLFRGLFKKMVVADMLALYVDSVFAAPGEYRGASAWIALYAYAFQIYMDFSGYSDVALACANLFGLKFTENFDRPYLAQSPSEFWRRWHISLSTWLRDYLFIPLGGSRGRAILTTRNLVITMALGGLWHGAAWTFVIWGIFHALLLCAQRAASSILRLNASPTLPTRILKTIFMFHAICLGWLFFRASDWANVQVMLASLFDFTPAELRGKRVLMLILCCAIAHLPGEKLALGNAIRKLPALGQGAFAALCLWTLLLISPAVRPFIYFQF